MTQTLGGYCIKNKELLKAKSIKTSLTEISQKELKLAPLTQADWDTAEVIITVLSRFILATKATEIENKQTQLSSTRLYYIYRYKKLSR